MKQTWILYFEWGLIFIAFITNKALTGKQGIQGYLNDFFFLT